MPYRKVPASDSGRIDALRNAKEKADSTPADQLAISPEVKSRLDLSLPQFKKEVDERGTALSIQSDSTKARLISEERCGVYVSHFYQVFNLGIIRGEYKASERAYFHIDVSQESIPVLKNEDSIKTNAENIISGDPLRVAAGGRPMMNPSKDEVQGVLNEYKSKLQDQSTKKDILEKEQEDVDAIRADIDDLIRDMWDEIEFKYRKDEPSVMRRKAREYGVVYVPRPGEPPEEITPPAPAPAP